MWLQWFWFFGLWEGSLLPFIRARTGPGWPPNPLFLVPPYKEGFVLFVFLRPSSSLFTDPFAKRHRLVVVHTFDAVRTPTLSGVVWRAREHDKRRLAGFVQGLHERDELLVGLRVVQVNHSTDVVQSRSDTMAAAVLCAHIRRERIDASKRRRTRHDRKRNRRNVVVGRLHWSISCTRTTRARIVRRYHC